MKLIFAYLVFLLLLIAGCGCVVLHGLLPSWLEQIHVLMICSLVGGVGGVTYCLRGIYISACVRKNWDEAWKPWYYIRPIVSAICGAVSFLFLKAGLLVLDAKQNDNSNLLGFYALSFIAGLNVDNFVKKLEDIAQATWGIKKSRTGQNDED
jgi:hypothetical protein